MATATLKPAPTPVLIRNLANTIKAFLDANDDVAAVGCGVRVRDDFIYVDVAGRQLGYVDVWYRDRFDLYLGGDGEYAEAGSHATPSALINALLDAAVASL